MSSWGNDSVPEGWTETDEASYQQEVNKYQLAFFHGPRIGGRNGEPVYAAILPPMRGGGTWEESRARFHTQNLAAAKRVANTEAERDRAVEHEMRSENAGRHIVVRPPLGLLRRWARKVGQWLWNL